MTPQYIIYKSLCREPFCASESNWKQTAESYIDNLEYSQEYAEPGYDIEWEDEWTTCDGCGKALRTSPNSYSWQPSFIRNGGTGECFCKECLTNDDLESLEDNPRTAVNLDGIDLSDYGYEEIKCGYESGWHAGQTDDPTKIYNELVKHGHSRLLFQIESVGQFDMSFCVWEKITDDDCF